MGLDVAFNREAAIAAGIEQTEMANGTPDEIIAAQAACDRGQGDPDYVRWLAQCDTCVRAPGMEHWLTDNGAGDNMVVRANKWGSAYAPLTRWLATNGISWSEA